MTKKSLTTDASVLAELKETIQRQQAEIASLKSKTTASTGGSHHAPVQAADDSYLSTPFFRIASQRIPWLSLFLVSLSGTALIMGTFEAILHQQLELAYFVPLLAGHGGNTGGQAVGMVLSALSSGQVRREHVRKVVRKEALSGLLAGSILGSIVGLVAAYGMQVSLHVATVVACTIPLVSMWAATLGSFLPFLCLYMGLEPSVIAAPAMTSLVDVCGLLSYFVIAKKIFAWYGVEL